MLKIGKSEVRISMVIKIAGAFCAFLIGAGFATGQEILQYFTNYGIGKAIGVMIINALLGAWTAAAVMNLGNESRDIQGLECYKNLCGKYVGTILSWFVPIFMFLTLMTMMAGFGSTFHQVFGGPEWIGSLLLAIIVTAVVLLGLASVIDTIGFIGPMIIVVTMVMAIGVIAKHGVDFENWNHYITTHDVLLASSSWAMAQSLSPILGFIYTIVLALAIFTTAVPLMWSVAARITREKTIKFAIICVVIAVLGFFGSYLPFETLVNIVTPAVGYVGFIGWLFIIWRDIKLIRAKFTGEPLPIPKDKD